MMLRGSRFVEPGGGGRIVGRRIAVNVGGDCLKNRGM
jgi:hypothetical protein